MDCSVSATRKRDHHHLPVSYEIVGKVYKKFIFPVQRNSFRNKEKPFQFDVTFLLKAVKLLKTYEMKSHNELNLIAIYKPASPYKTNVALQCIFLYSANQKKILIKQKYLSKLVSEGQHLPLTGHLII